MVDHGAGSANRTMAHFLLKSRRVISSRLLAIAILFASLSHSQSYDQPPPNIVLILADQLRFDSSYSSPAHQTPNLDRLAQRGACFTAAYSSTPTCTPARAALLTGQSPWQHGMLGYGDVAPHGYDVDLSRLLQDAGYETAVIGKNHFGWNATTAQGIPHGYETMYLYDGLSGYPDDYYKFFKSILPNEDPMKTGLEWNDWASRTYVFDEALHPTSWTGRQVLSYLRNRTATRTTTGHSKDQPFFLKLSFHRPHSPYDPPQRWLDRVNTSAVALPHVGGNWDVVYQHTKGCGGRDAWCGLFDDKDVLKTRAAYLASIMMVDDWIGRVYDAIQELAPNTFFIVTSDHGDMQGDHNLWRKGYPYEGSSHIPMLIAWPEGSKLVPESKRGTHVNAVVELRDVMPTIAEIAGVELSRSPRDTEVNPGQSMLCLLSESSCQWRPYLDLEHNRVYNITVHWNALTNGRQKYVFHANSGDEQLFDLTRDPYERFNQVMNKDYAFDLALWRSRLVKQFRTEGRGPKWVSQNGILQRRSEGQLYSPHYPGRAPPNHAPSLS